MISTNTDTPNTGVYISMRDFLWETNTGEFLGILSTTIRELQEMGTWCEMYCKKIMAQEYPARMKNNRCGNDVTECTHHVCSSPAGIT